MLATAWLLLLQCTDMQINTCATNVPVLPFVSESQVLHERVVEELGVFKEPNAPVRRVVHKTFCHNYIGHNYIGHNYIGQNCIGHNYIAQFGGYTRPFGWMLWLDYVRA